MKARFLVVTAALLASACLEGPRCENDAQCDDHDVCLDHRCVAGTRDGGIPTSSSSEGSSSSKGASSFSTGSSGASSGPSSSSAQFSSSSSVETSSSSVVDACAALPVLVEGANAGTTLGHASTVEPTCIRTTGVAGNDVVYRYVPGAPVDLLLSLRSDGDLTLSVLDGCGSTAAFTACAEAAGAQDLESLELRNLAAGVPVYIAVSEHFPSSGTAFTLDVHARAIVEDGTTACDPEVFDARCGGARVCAAAVCQEPVSLGDACASVVTQASHVFTIGDITTSRIVYSAGGHNVVTPGCAIAADGPDDVMHIRTPPGTGQYDVSVQLDGLPGHTVSIRSTCADSSTEKACLRPVDGMQTRMLDGLPGNMDLFIFISADSDAVAGAGMLTVLVGSSGSGGRPCDGSPQSCPPTETCDFTGHCSAGAVPLLSSLEALRVDEDAAGAFSTLRLIISGAWNNEVFRPARIRFLDENGAYVPIIDADGPRAELLPTMAGTADTFTNHILDVSGFSHVSNAADFHSVEVRLGARLVSLPVTAVLGSMTTTPVGSACVQGDAHRRCRGDAVCQLVDGGNLCVDPSVAACAGAQSPSGGELDLGAFQDVMSASCGSPGAGDIIVDYVASMSGPSDVIAEFQAPRGSTELLTLAWRSTCADPSSETTCGIVSGHQSAVARNVEPGGHRYLVVSPLSGSVASGTIVFSERHIIAADAPCDPDLTSTRCEDGTFCTRNLVCSAAHPPSLVTAPIRVVKFGSEAQELRVEVDASDTDADLAELHLVPVTTGDVPVTLYRAGPAGPVPITLTRRFEPAPTSTHLDTDVAFDVRGVINLDETIRFRAFVRDSTGLDSTALTGLLQNPTTIQGAGMPCNATGLACGPDLECHLATCRTRAQRRADACAAAPVLTTNVARMQTGTSQLDVVDSPCSGAGKDDVIFRYSVQQRSDVTFRTTGSSVDTLTVVDACATGGVIACGPAIGLESAGTITVEDVAAGTELALVVKTRSPGQMVGATASERPIALQGEACGDGIQFHCVRGTSCDVDNNMCAALCGNFSIDLGESCEDGDSSGGDGCSSTCLDECRIAQPPAPATTTLSIPMQCDGRFVVTPAVLNPPRQDVYVVNVQQDEELVVDATDPDRRCDGLNATIGLFTGSAPVATAPIDCRVPDPRRVGCGQATNQSSCPLARFTAPSTGPVRIVFSGQGRREYALHVKLNHPVCGDGRREGREQCDDGNLGAQDRCGMQCEDLCTIPAVEMGTLPQSVMPTQQCSGLMHITPAVLDGGGDQDVYALSAQAGDMILARLTSPDGRECSTRARLDLWDGQVPSDALLPGGCQSSATMPLGCSDGYDGCPSLMVPVTAAGTFHVRVAPQLSTETPLPYRLALSIAHPVCLDMRVDPGEQCDDGNQVNFDGCGNNCMDRCVTIPTGSSPASPQPLVFQGPCSARQRVDGSINTQGGSEYFSVALTAGQKLTVQTFSDDDGTCPPLNLDTQLELFKGPLMTTPVDGHCGTPAPPRLACNDDVTLAQRCSRLEYVAPVAGTWVVRVRGHSSSETGPYVLRASIAGP